MSFLNPISLPVRRFSSTDEGAPQIDQNNRVAGDIKILFKACFVTGYGDKEGAGWTIQNDTDDDKADFVSPAVAMSDYVFKLIDTESKSTWSYQYINTVNTIDVEMPTKSANRNVNKSGNNGWTMLVTDYGFCFIEHFDVSNLLDGIASRITYFGQIKSALVNQTGHNMFFMCAGQNQNFYAHQIFEDKLGRELKLNEYTQFDFSHAALPSISTYGKRADNSSITISDALYLNAENMGTATHEDAFEVIGQLPGIIIETIASTNRQFAVSDETYNNRPVLCVDLGRKAASEAWFLDNACPFRTMIYLDNWEY